VRWRALFFVRQWGTAGGNSFTVLNISENDGRKRTPTATTSTASARIIVEVVALSPINGKEEIVKKK
jgi:hypothetical protein